MAHMLLKVMGSMFWGPKQDQPITPDQILVFVGGQPQCLLGQPPFQDSTENLHTPVGILIYSISMTP